MCDGRVAELVSTRVMGWMPGVTQKDITWLGLMARVMQGISYDWAGWPESHEEQASVNMLCLSKLDYVVNHTCIEKQIISIASIETSYFASITSAIATIWYGTICQSEHSETNSQVFLILRLCVCQWWAGNIQRVLRYAIETWDTYQHDLQRWQCDCWSDSVYVQTIGDIILLSDG